MQIGNYELFIHKSRYARWMDGEQRRESLPETIDRYFDYMTSKVSVPTETLTRLKRSVSEFSVMPSMRALMTAGPALERDNTAGFNPVAGDTLVITRDGNLPIKDLSGKTAEVINKDGRWADATFRSYGVQDTIKLVFGSADGGNYERTIEATHNHRWYKTDGSVVSTDDLEVGDLVPFTHAPRPEIDQDYRLGVLHGLVYGDGTSVKSCGRTKGYMIRLCGDSQCLLSMFDGYKVSYPTSTNEDPIVYLYDDFAATHSLKDLPSLDETDSYLLGFVRGWLAADGSVGSRNPQITLCVTDPGLDWINLVAPRIGMIIQNSYQYSDATNYGQRRSRAFNVVFDRASMLKEDFIHTKKAELFKPMTRTFKLKSKEVGLTQEVFCAEVPDTNTFTLSCGMVTGNCSYLPIDDPVAFDEAMYILLCGTGVGFSVENKYIAKLPLIPSDLKHDPNHVILVQDSKEGWALAERELLSFLWSGVIPSWNTSLVREKGARLKTFGGRASGPEPLIELFEFTVDLFWHARGRRLTDIECHDLMCKIGDIIVVGGVRRSAMISLSDLESEAMAKAKSMFPIKSLSMLRDEGHFAISYVDCDGQLKSAEITLSDKEFEIVGQTSQIGWWKVQPQRALSNNSAVYDGPVMIDQFSKEWAALIASRSGERGIFNRAAAREQARKTGRRDWNVDFGTNPCGEIILRPCQFCNLTEVVARNEDTLSRLMDKVEGATILGTYQATMTDFPYLRPIWKKNTEEERLLGVSMTGIMDHPVLAGQNGHGILSEWLDQLRVISIATNKEWAERFGINPSTSITCVKPSGTVSQLVNSASGIHPRHSHYYIRSVRSDNKDPITRFMMDSGVPHEPCLSKPKTTTIFYFPIKAPEDSITRNNLTSIEHLEIWKIYRTHWCEHNPSITVTVRDEEWMEVGSWVFRNMDEICGIALLPHTDHIYAQAPYQEVDRARYQKLLDRMPYAINWDRLSLYEAEDNTVSMQLLACVSGYCEI